MIRPDPGASPEYPRSLSAIISVTLMKPNVENRIPRRDLACNLFIDSMWLFHYVIVSLCYSPSTEVGRIHRSCTEHGARRWHIV